ncbi:MAG: hypothetical protein OEV70_14710, partial [Nitrospirota bacterium]|nr:hypothetical protein [Nitrospirota bacterium]
SLGQTVGAEETTQEEFPDRLKLYGGYQQMFGLDGKFRFNGSKTGFGSTWDFNDDLGGDKNDSMLRAGATFRFNQNHAIGFSWYDINLKGDRTLDDSLQIKDDIFQVGGEIKSKLDLTLYRLFYNWSFYHSDKTELVLSPGMYFGDFEANFKGSAVIDAESINQISGSKTIKENLFAPLPTIGVAVAYKIFPRLTANLRTDWFYVNVGEVNGSIAELFIGLEYRVFKHFAVGVAYDRMLVNVEYKNGKAKGWELDVSWNSGLFYGALYF